MQGFDPLRVKMIDDLAMADVHRLDLLHIFIGQSKIKNIKILLHAFFVNRFRDHHNAALDVPPSREYWGQAPGRKYKQILKKL